MEVQLHTFLILALDRVGQLHATVALAPAKWPPLPIENMAGWGPEPIWTHWQRENIPSAPLLGNKP